MKTRSAFAVMLCACLAFGSAPAAYAAGAGGSALAAGKLATQATAKGTVKVSWKQPKSRDSGTDYAVRYSYSKSMKNAKEVMGISGTSTTLKGLKKGKRVYVQVCACKILYNRLSGEWYDHYSEVSRWTPAKSVKVPSTQPTASEQPEAGGQDGAGGASGSGDAGTTAA